MKRSPAWLRYSLLRLLFIAVPLAILLVLFGSHYWIVWVVASTIIGFALSYIFLGKTREAMAQELLLARGQKPVAKGDDAVEDAEIDASDHPDDPE